MLVDPEDMEMRIVLSHDSCVLSFSLALFLTGSPPKIEALSQNMSVEVRQTLTVSGAFPGEPTPFVQWIRSGQSIPTEEKRYDVENSMDNCTLMISAVKEGDVGAHTLKLANEFGCVAATVNVHIRSI